MQKIGEQIQIEKKDAHTVVTVHPIVVKKHLNLLKIWVVAWSICGILVASQLFVPYQNSEKVFLAIYLSLWLYFEIKTVKALRWNLYGKEIIEITEKEFLYTELIGKRGIPVIFPKEKIKEISLIQQESKGFLADINQSVWMLGTETIVLATKDFSKNIGRKLSENDAAKLTVFLNKLLTENA
jgi:hypothetical protein